MEDMYVKPECVNEHNNSVGLRAVFVLLYSPGTLGGTTPPGQEVDPPLGQEVDPPLGNQERGWNDPPQFSYGLQTARGPQRNLLNRRAAPPTASGARAPPTASLSSNTLPPPLCSVAPPPLPPAPPPPGRVATPPLCLGLMRSRREADSSQSESEPDVEGVVSVLSRALAACRHSVKDQVCNDVAKRLRLLEDSWRSGRLSLPVRRRMDSLSLELQSGRWDAADEIHRSLMVDHVTEVSQWMVGVKRLIAETRNLSPDLLEPLQKPTGPAPDSAEPAPDSAEPVLTF